MMPTLESLMPDADKGVVYHRRVHATPNVVRQAIDQVEMRELGLTKLLMAIRSLGRWNRSGRVIEALPPKLVASDDDGVILTLAAHRRRGLTVAPALEDIRRYNDPGWLVIAVDLRVAESDDGTDLSTETRVLATDPATRRAFTLYWAAIRAGTGLIRRELLHAIAARAEKSEPSLL